MKIAVYGATGMVGSQIVAEALTRGHEVTAVSRSGAEVPGAASAQAELTDVAAYRELAQGHDVVMISVPTPRDGSDHGPIRAAHEEIAETLVPARVFVVGGAGALELPGGGQLRETEGFPPEYKSEADSFAEILSYYEDSSGVNWTMLAPAPVIAPGERTGEYKVGVNNPVGDSISTQDFAVAVLDELEEPKNENRRFTVAN
ncbi:NAD(P)H-binding protein [Zhihengliuella alba]|uniref:NAD(P)H-binding protein n=1 Tax=Zhihengliuella alba TaxID=547018 RepID=A0ABP7DQC6_9MICC